MNLPVLMAIILIPANVHQTGQVRKIKVPSKTKKNESSYFANIITPGKRAKGIKTI